MKIEFIAKLKNYSYKKQFFILFFIATWDVWIMPILSILIYATGLDSMGFFQAEYREFLWNTTPTKPFSPELITHSIYYYIFITLPIHKFFELYIPFLEKFPIAINIFQIISFYLFIIILKSKEQISKNKKRLIVFFGILFYYFLGYFIAIIGLLSSIFIVK